MRLACATALIVLVWSMSATAMTVDDAYRAVPHKRTAYDPALSPRSPAEKEFLAKLLALSDRALVERVETLQALRAGDATRFEAYRDGVRQIRRELAALSEPSTATGLSKTLSDAIEHQERFLAKWGAALSEHRPFSVPLGSDDDVRAASGLLIGLYSQLKSRYADEHPHNLDAFYQYLCALDFL